MRIIIIDDEAPAREIIKSYLKDYTDIEVCAEYSDGFSGLKGIKEHHPDLIFLDIQMPKITGFEMLELLENHPEIIFTTAYDQYAIKAFEINAVDYLLKPFSKERFNKALTKVKEKLTTNNKNKQTGISKKIIETIDKEKNDYIFRIVVKKKDNIHVIPVDNLIYIEAKDDYVMLYTENSRYLKEKTMKYYETHLVPRTFVRVHRSYIVRINQVKRLEPYGKSSYIAILQQEQKVNVSLSGYKRLKEILNF